MTFTDSTQPTWKQIREMQNEIDMLHAENALKLTQILDLEQTLYFTRILELNDGSPCWCCRMEINLNLTNGMHERFCDDARQATKPFWKKQEHI